MVQAAKAAVVLLIAIALFGLWNRIETNNRRLARPDLMALGMGGFLAWGLAGAAWANTPGLAIPQVAALVGLILAGTLAVEALRLVSADRLLVFAMAGMIAASVVTWIDIHTGYHLTWIVHSGHGEKIPGRFKAGVTILALWSVALTWAGLRRRRWVWTGLSLAAVLILARSVDSLAATMALAGGLTVGAATYYLPRLVPALVGAAAMAVVLAAPVAIHMPAPKDLITMAPILPNSTLHRAMIWHFVAERVMERPILGWGLDGSRAIPGGDDDELIWLHFGAGGMESLWQQRLPLHPHNAPLQIWLEAGAVGAILFGLILVGVARRCAMPRERGAKAMATATFAAALAIGGVAYGIWQAWWLASLWLIAALVARLAKTDEPSPD
jgi:O-antigen ligase